MRKKIFSVAIAIMTLVSTSVFAQDNNVVTKVKETTSQAADKVSDTAKNLGEKAKEFGNDVKTKVKKEACRANKAIKSETRQAENAGQRAGPNSPQKNLTQRSQTAHAGKYAIKQEPHVTTLSNASIRPSSLAVAKVYTKASAMRNNSNQPL